MTSARKELLAIAMFVLAFAVPVVAGLAGMLHLHARESQPEWTPVCNVQALPAGGVPHAYLVRVPRFDAWSRLPDEVVGAVFLRRVDQTDEVCALNMLYKRCCGVEYDAKAGTFHVPCWNVQFDLDGHILHSTREWSDMQPVQTLRRGDIIYVSVADAMSLERTR